MTPEVDLHAEPEGLLVQASDGQVFFLPKSEQARLAAPSEHVEVLRKLFSTSPGSAPVAQPEFSCETLWNWMMHHDPNTMAWRKVSVMWINQC